MFHPASSLRVRLCRRIQANDMIERTRLIIAVETCPQLPRSVKLQQDKSRDCWVLLAPERVLTPDDIAVEILRLCNGKRSVEEISSTLAETYNAPIDEIRNDVIELLQNLADKGYVVE